MIATWTILNVSDNILCIKKRELAHALSFFLNSPMKVERIKRMSWCLAFAVFQLNQKSFSFTKNEDRKTIGCDKKRFSTFEFVKCFLS